MEQVTRSKGSMQEESSQKTLFSSQLHCLENETDLAQILASDTFEGFLARAGEFIIERVCHLLFHQ